MHRVSCVFMALMAMLLVGVVSEGMAAPLPKLQLRTGGGAVITVDTWNQPRLPGQVGVFDAWFGPTTMNLAPVLEVQVAKGVVQASSNTGDSAIPADGFTVSMDGRAAEEWVRLNAVPGTPVTVSPAQGWIAAYESMVTLDGMNAARRNPGLYAYNGSAPPGVRNAKPGEQAWEAVVAGGMVVSAGSPGAKIPVGGMVIGAYGAGPAMDWAKSDLEVGVRVSLTGNTLTVKAGPERYVFIAQQALGALTAKSQSAEVLRALTPVLVEASTDIGNGRLDDGVAKALRVLHTADFLVSVQGPSQPVEMRGVWHRPVERNADEVAKTVQTMAKANINTVFLETLYRGKSIFPTPLGVQHEAFSGWDPLAVWVEEAHKVGIEVHAWIHTLRVTEDSPVLKEHPEWAQVVRDKALEPVGTPARHTGVEFLDPSNPGVVAHVGDLVDGIAGVYGVDGIHLDYIRYASADPLPKGYSYGVASRASFMADWGVDPESIAKSNRMLDSEWNQWRKDKVTALVAGIRESLLRIRPDMALSAAVVGDLSLAASSKLQDWPDWVKDGLLDFVTPMLYHSESAWVASAARKAAGLTGAGSRTMVVGGIGPYVGLSGPRLADQIKAVRGSGSTGTSMFALHSLMGGQLRMLQAGPFRDKALQPHRMHGLTAAVANLLGSLDAYGVKDAVGQVALVDWLSAPSPRALDALASLNALGNAGLAQSGISGAVDTAIRSALAVVGWNRRRQVPMAP